MLISRPFGGLSLPQTKRGLAIQPEGRPRPSDSIVPNGAPTPPPDPPKKPGHGWLGGHLGVEGGEQLLHLKGEAKGVAADAVHTALHAPAPHSMLMATGALGAASGGLGLVLLSKGAREVKEGLEHGDWRHTLEGTGSLMVGTRSLAAGTMMAGHLWPNLPVLTESAALAETMMTPLGLAHGALDAGLGLKDVVDGLGSKDNSLLTQGALGIGMGASLMAAAAGGGLPALASAGFFLAGRVWHGLSKS